MDPEKYLKSKPPPSTKTDSKLPVELRYMNRIKEDDLKNCENLIVVVI